MVGGAEPGAGDSALAQPLLVPPWLRWEPSNSWMGNERPLGVAERLTPGAIPLQAKYKAREAALKAQSERKPAGEREERGKLPESPKRAEEIWQQSVIGDYLARFKVGKGRKRVVLQPAHSGLPPTPGGPLPPLTPLSVPRMTG